MSNQTSEKKLLTIVVPCYNMADYIENCLRSVTDSTVPDSLEVIVVNDGSTDNSMDIIKKYQKIRPDIIRILDKSNAHQGSCINAGVKLATGKYFRILDADDWVDITSLYNLLHKLETCDTDLVITLRTENIFDNGKKEKVIQYHIDNLKYDYTYNAKEFCISEHIEGAEFNIHSMTYKTNILKSIPIKLPERIYYTDLLFCMLPIDCIKTFIIYEIYLYHYRIGREGQSTEAISIAKNFSHTCVLLTTMIKYMDSKENTIGTIHANQLYFAKEALDLFLNSIRNQHCLPKGYGNIITNIGKGIRRHNLDSRLLNKYYFKIWKITNSLMLLKISMSIYRMTHKKTV